MLAGMASIFDFSPGSVSQLAAADVNVRSRKTWALAT